MGARLSADLREGLETTNAAVEELGRLGIKLTTQHAETVQRSDRLCIHGNTVTGQHGGSLLSIGGVETGMDVVDTKAETVTQHFCRTDVRQNHGLFNDAVSDTARFSHDLQHFAFFTQQEAVIRAIFKHQRVGLTPLAARQAETVQQTNLFRNRITFRLPAAAVFQPVRDIVVGQLGFGLNPRGKEFDVITQGAIGCHGHAAGQRRTAHIWTQRADIIREFARQHRDVEARQVVGERTLCRQLIELTAFRHIGSRIGDSDGQTQRAIILRFHIERIIHILGAGAVDGDEIQRGQIFTRQIFIHHLTKADIGRFTLKVMTRQCHPPRRQMVIGFDNKIGKFGIKAAIALQRMAAHFRHCPVAIFKCMADIACRATLNGIFQQGVIRHNRQAIVFLLHPANKAAQERFNQGFRLSAFAIFVAVDDGGDTIAMHHFLHLRWRNEVTFLRIDFQKAEAFFGAFNDAFSTRRLRMELLFQLREQRVILEHNFYVSLADCG